MVSAFLCECHGVLRLTYELQAQFRDITADSTVFLKPGANNKGYWKNRDLIYQVTGNAIPIFRVLHPNCDGLLMFDNSQNHHAKPPDALSVSEMNLITVAPINGELVLGAINTVMVTVSSKRWFLRIRLSQRASNLLFKREIYGIRH